MRRLVILALVVLGSHIAVAISQDVTIPSKDYTRAMFSMTKDDWNSNVQQAVAVGAAEAAGAPETGLAIATTTPDRILIVKPDYGLNIQKPEFIHVTVGYREQSAALLTNLAVQEMIRVAREKMQPEYRVMGDFERLHNGLSVHFTIFEMKSD